MLHVMDNAMVPLTWPCREVLLPIPIFGVIHPQQKTLPAFVPEATRLQSLMVRAAQPPPAQQSLSPPPLQFLFLQPTQAVSAAAMEALPLPPAEEQHLIHICGQLVMLPLLPIVWLLEIIL